MKRPVRLGLVGLGTVGGGVVAVVVIVVLSVVLTQGSASQIDQFCAGPGGCVRVDAAFLGGSF